jgi:hypothetical protein
MEACWVFTFSGRVGAGEGEYLCAYIKRIVECHFE